MEMINQNNAIVGSTTWSDYYVRILSTINRELLKPSASVALHLHSNALVDVLAPEDDSSISLLIQSEKPDVTYNLVLLICVTKVAKSAFDKSLAEHEDIDDVIGSEEPNERDHGVDL
ncbi:26s proteasome regulatory subunit 6B [Orobanche minor]